ncbi:MAG: hypothetical protein AAFS10_13285, partial [Myxococcota bacterium]
MGTFRAKVDIGPNGMPTYKFTPQEEVDYANGQGTTPTGGFMAQVYMRPPNLKIKVERAVRSPFDEEDDEPRVQVVGANGAAITDDQWLRITTEWFDEDGGPLPDNLPGFTGRLARVVNGKLVGGTADEVGDDDVGYFSIKPGKHIVNLQLPSASAQNVDVALDRQHFYIHVSAAPTEELAAFAGDILGDDRPQFYSDRVCYQRVESGPDGQAQTGWTCVPKPEDPNLQGRPALLVPFQVARFDRTYTERLADEQARQLQESWQEGDPLPVVGDVETVYRWIYSPEMQFSVYDLDVHEINVTTSPDADGDEQLGVTVDYDLTAPDSADLSRPGGEGEPDDGLYWGVGYERVEATISQGDEGSTIAELAGSVTPSEYIGLDLFVDGDESNPLFEVSELALLYGDVRRLVFARMLRKQVDYNEPEGSDEAILDSQVVMYTTDLLRGLTTRAVDVECYIEQPGSEVRTSLLPVDPLSGRAATQREGEFFVPISAKDILDAGVDPEVSQDFTIVIEASWPMGSDDPLLVHQLRYPGLLVDVQEDWGEGLSLDAMGKLGSQAGADGMFSENASGSSGAGGMSARSMWGQGGASLTDGSVKVQRHDINVPTIGPELAFTRSYSNLDGQASESTLGIGWSHGMDIKLIPIALEGERDSPLPEWFKRLKSMGLVSRSHFRAPHVPDRWGEVIVKGVRFIRQGENWIAENGYQGELIEQGGEFVYTDLEGVVYTFAIPVIPMPDPDEEPEDVDRALGSDDDNDTDAGDVGTGGGDGDVGSDGQTSGDEDTGEGDDTSGDGGTSGGDEGDEGSPPPGPTVLFSNRLIHRIKSTTLVEATSEGDGEGEPDPPADGGDAGGGDGGSSEGDAGHDDGSRFEGLGQDKVRDIFAVGGGLGTVT